ncbi:MAG: hypothetical protein ACK5V9_09715 [Burkholderiales bacterium]|jgi:hypothetical protein
MNQQWKTFHENFPHFCAARGHRCLAGVGGGATLTPNDMLSMHAPGEQSLYGVVAGKPRKLHELTDYKDFRENCGQQIQPDVIAASANEWLKKHVCGNMEKWQFVPIVYHTKVWGAKGIKAARAFAPIDLIIEEDDVLEFSMDTSIEGRKIRPDLVKRVARKAKDATKESGCYWDGGKGATTAFIGGGAVCDGWNWRDQKFAKE